MIFTNSGDTQCYVLGLNTYRHTKIEFPSMIIPTKSRDGNINCSSNLLGPDYVLNI